MNTLLIEDNPGDIRLIQEIMRGVSPSHFYLSYANTLQDGFKTLSQKAVEIIFLDLSLPDSQGLNTLNKMRLHTAGQIPIIVLTGLDNDEIALQALKEGAQDYLIKGKFDGSILMQTARYAIERHKLKIALEEKTKELKQSNEELENFSHVVSHDLQSPLNTLIAFGKLLKEKNKKNLNDKSRDYLNRMKNAAMRMKNLIEDLLEFAQVHTNGKSFTSVNLKEVIQEALSDLEILILRSRAKINVGRLSSIQGDPQQIRQLFQNLIENGLKFSKKGKPPQIKISGKKMDNFYEIKIRDHGIGFDEKFSEEIFKPFTRLQNKNDYKGSGLGLATCKKIVGRHRGNIIAQSSLGKGSTFIIHFPLPISFKAEK